jgi:hypothetical protein
MTPLSTSELLGACVRLPQHVVYRSFVAETVVLNLNTGKYHGLNPTAGEMLEALLAAPTVRATLPELASKHGIEPEQIERDLLALIQGLLERGLIETVDDGSD